MKALILAAGFGTRLRPLTDEIPKALVQVGSLTLLERAVDYLKKNGVEEIALNSHSLADKIEFFVRNKKDWGLLIKIFFEPEILGVGGAIKNAADFLKDSEPFIVFNADILTDIDLNFALNFFQNSQALVTLLVNNRETARPLLVDKNNYLVGHLDKTTNVKRLVATSYEKPLKEVGFTGIHIVSPKIFTLMPKNDKFGVVDFYLDLVAHAQLINVMEFNAAYWRDVGTFERLKQAQADIRSGIIK